MAVKATKGADITARVNALAHRKGRPTDFEIRMLKRDIEGIRNADLGEYYMLLGMAYSLAGDVENSISNHESSLRVSGDMVDYANYALSMRRLLRREHSLDLMLKAFEIGNYSKEIFSDVIGIMLYCGDFRLFDEVMERFSKANPGVEPDERAGVISAIREDLNDLGIPGEDYQASLAIVESVVVSHGRSIESIDVVPSSFDGVAHLHGQIYVDTDDAEELTVINNQLVEAMIASEQLTSWDRLIFNAVPCSVEETSVA